jgi:flavin-dependent dehydrogenase
VDPASVSAVAGLDYAGPVRDDGTVRIGDAYALIPPFTGHGMAMAFESAQLALGPLERWALGRDDWTTAARGVRRRLDAAFRRRLTAARLLHRFLLRPRWQAVFARLHGAGVLPFTPVYRLLH